MRPISRALKWNFALVLAAIPFLLSVAYLVSQSENNGVWVVGGDQDHGLVRQNSVEKYKIILVNASFDPVYVTVVPGCRCTTADITKHKVSSPGLQNIFVHVRTADSRRGHHVKSIQIYFQSQGMTWSRTASFAYDSL